MKKTFLAFVAFIAFGITLQAAQAQYNGYAYEITPMLTKQVSTADAALDDSKIFYGIRAAVRASDIVSLQIGYERSDNAKMGDGGKSDIARGVVNLLLDLPNKSRVTPYILMGAGYEKLFRTYADETSQAFLNGGAGLKYALSEKVDLITEGRIIQKIENKDTDAILGAGLSFKYGAKNAVNTIYTNKQTIHDTPKVQVQEVREVAIPVQDLAKITPPKPVEVIRDVAPVQEVAKTAVVEPTVVVQEIVQEVPVEDISALEPVEFIGETDYVMSEATIVEDFIDTGLYVQMEASFGEPSGSLLNKLDRGGYPYVLHPATRRGKNTTLVLVGPFTSAADAKNDLSSLKKIKRDAFIYKMK